MIIKRTSILTGIERERDIDVTPGQLKSWNRGQNINVAMSNIPKDDREFIVTGTIQEEWENFSKSSVEN
jgi:hypothetical protein|tara:strand:+ start:13481 stop:13687 length:207 start_codon:yes stop_codon:yes gene_type:complete